MRVRGRVRDRRGVRGGPVKIAGVETGLTETIAASQLLTEELLEWERIRSMLKRGHKFKSPHMEEYQMGRVKQAAKNLVAISHPLFRSVVDGDD